MSTLIIVLAIASAVLVILAVLVQDSKGGLGSQFGSGGASQMFGAKRSTDFVEKFTWGVAIVFMGLSIGATVYKKNNVGTGEQNVNWNEKAAQQGNPAIAPTAPAPVPVEPEGE